MAITFKPLRHKNEIWNEADLKIKLDTLVKQINGRRICVKRNLTLKKANILQRMIWPIAQNSQKCRKWFLGIDTRSNQLLFKRIGYLISTKITLQNDTSLIQSYNQALSLYTTYLTKIGKKTAKKYAVDTFALKISGHTPASEDFKNKLLTHLYLKKRSSFSDWHFKKIAVDFTAAENLDDFCLRLAEGEYALMPPSIKFIRQFINENADGAVFQSQTPPPPFQKAPLCFKQVQEPLFAYLDENKRKFGKDSKERNTCIVKIKNAFIAAQHESEFFSYLLLPPHALDKNQIKKIKDLIATLLNVPSPKNPIEYTPVADRLFPSIQQRCLSKDPDLYPTQLITKPFTQAIKSSFLVDSGSTFKKNYNQIAISNLEQYVSAFKSQFTKPVPLKATGCPFDIHDRQFQNFALFLLEGKTNEEIQDRQHPNYYTSPAQNAACLQLIRARNFAIASREDVDWKGNFISKEKNKDKLAQMQANWKSLTLYDWAGLPDENFAKKTGNKKTQISITEEDTFSAIKRMAKTCDPAKLAWVNMASAHHPGGSYQNGGRGQEETTVTNSDAIVVLSQAAKICTNTGQAIYQKNLHIPPGGNYFHQTTIFTISKKPITCNSIVQPFADFRMSTDPETEFIDYQSENKLNVVSRRYIERIKLDMKGVLRTAKKQGQEVLILGATGCGKLQHHTMAEAKAWSAVLNDPEFAGHFKEVIFTMPKDHNPDDYDSFTKIFSH
ncbi:MAG: TIGR02452 family protein [Parachlamydia sp.]|nr:MAG: TIGR02452 family protein [Parachlamydia sp.]